MAEKTAVQTYQDEDYQPIYFVAESFDEAKSQLRFFFFKNNQNKLFIENFFLFYRKYSRNIKRPYQVRYDPFTQSIKVVDNFQAIQEIQRSIQIDTELMLKSIDKMMELKVWLYYMKLIFIIIKTLETLEPLEKN